MNRAGSTSWQYRDRHCEPNPRSFITWAFEARNRDWFSIHETGNGLLQQKRQGWNLLHQPTLKPNHTILSLSIRPFCLRWYQGPWWESHRGVIPHAAGEPEIGQAGVHFGNQVREITSPTSPPAPTFLAYRPVDAFTRGVFGFLLWPGTALTVTRGRHLQCQCLVELSSPSDGKPATRTTTRRGMAVYRDTAPSSWVRAGRSTPSASVVSPLIPVKATHGGHRPPYPF